MDRVWGHFLYDPEPGWERTRLERQDELAAEEYADERRADLNAEGVDDQWVIA